MREHRTCRVLRFSRFLLKYEPRPDHNLTLRARLRDQAEQRRRFDGPRLHVLLRREGWIVNHKRVE